MEAVVDHVVNHLVTALDQERFKPLGMATGRTMEPFYAALIQRLATWPSPQFEQLKRCWLSFNLDEYVGLPPEDSRSFAAYMHTQLGCHLDLSHCQLQLPDGMAKDSAEEARRYGSALHEAGGIGLQLLGLGGNGHVGFNEPPSQPGSGCRVVTLEQATRIQNASAFGGNPEEVPEQAITLGLDEILAADEIHLIVTGAAKAEILRTALLDPCSAEVPASWLQRHSAVHLWVDDAASAHLPMLS
ncbi:glucosamine-6-phosphate deaminase [Synechococcus sp. BIOS-U3-1]|uniref:glucosamine-6-phosphate deaminase n=1 Tax=Synechococcus sp. BIOS-U3-1 TaxID=1400865 RepID=UPI000C375A9A|nr:N-acetylglucosamine-6-phosphate isomerase [Synechococcus sp. CPC100]QNI59637.1 glucosamine-6-phosphate deaminase [Synechococcus sp. BIOS-U3-1]